MLFKRAKQYIMYKKNEIKNTQKTSRIQLLK